MKKYLIGAGAATLAYAALVYVAYRVVMESGD